MRGRREGTEGGEDQRICSIICSIFSWSTKNWDCKVLMVVCGETLRKQGNKVSLRAADAMVIDEKSACHRKSLWKKVKRYPPGGEG